MLKAFDGYDDYNPSIPLGEHNYSSINARAQNFVQYFIAMDGENTVVFPGFNNYGGAFLAEGFADQGWAAVFGDKNNVAFMGWRTEIPGNNPGGFTRSVWAFSDQQQPSGQWNFAINSDKTISVYRGGLGLLNTPDNGQLFFTSSPIDFEFDTEIYVEVGFKLDIMNGWIIIRFDEIEVVNLSGINNQAGTFNTFDSATICFEGFNSFASRRIDDFYYCDDIADFPNSGIFQCNTFLGACRVYTEFPIAQGSVQFSPQPNTNFNYQNVLEPKMDSDTTYNSSQTVGQEDNFYFSGPPNMTINLVLGVTAHGFWKKDDAGLREIQQFVALDGVPLLGATYSLPDTDYVYFEDLWTLNPLTGKLWTTEDLYKLNAGYKLAA